MDKNFFIEYYDLERQHWWFKVREKIIIDKLRGFLSKKASLIHPIEILNVGVASGRSSEVLASFGNVTSLEYDYDCCEFTREKTGLNIINGSVLDLPFENDSFDVVCAFDVVEHVENDNLAIAEMKRVCKRGGIVFIAVPAFNILWSHHDIVNHHFRRYSMSEIDKLFEGPKIKIITRSYFNTILFPFILFIRVASKIFPRLFTRKEAGSDFTLLKQNSFANRLSFILFSFERKLLNYTNLPFGVSIIYAIEKQ